MNHKNHNKSKILSVAVFLSLVSCLLFPVVPSVSAQTLTSTPSAGSVDVTNSAFKIIICDGPERLNHLKPSATDPNQLVYVADYKANPNFVPCDFNGAMMQAQHLIDIAMVVGVLAAILIFTYAGYLYITGKEANISKAKSMFPKVLWGFVIMLAAWFIVYQLLEWLTGNSGFTKLLGNP